MQAVVAKHGRGAEGLLVIYIDLIRQEMTIFQNGAPEDAAVPIADFDACFHAALSQGPRDGVMELKQHLAASQQGGGLRLPWQDCLIALAIKDVMRCMWDTLCDAEKHIFQTKYSTLLNIHANSMPASSGVDLLRYLQSSETECSLRGALQSTVAVAKAEGGGFQLQFSDSSLPIHVEYVINAMGFGKHFTPSDSTLLSPLYRQLCDRAELVQPCVFGGLVSDFHTGRLLLTAALTEADAEEEGEQKTTEAPLLYAVGHLVSGTKLMTSGVSFCLMDGAAAVDDMVESLRNKNI